VLVGVAEVQDHGRDAPVRRAVALPDLMRPGAAGAPNRTRTSDGSP